MKMFVSCFFVPLLLTFMTVAANKECPDRSSCTDSESTCCKINSGGYDCCPLSNAVCCPSGLYCCPSGTTCNEKNGSCTMKDEWADLSPTFMAVMNEPFLPANLDWSGNKCPDKEQECSEKETCCKLESGGFGCCPYPGAVCCSDGQHCCPHGSQCDLKEQKCSRKGTELFLSSKLLPEMKSWGWRQQKSSQVGVERGGSRGGGMEKFNQEHHNVRNVLSAVICPGKEVQCPDESTCCELKDGQQGCCPLPKAVCCKDQVHCCPDGFACLDTGCKKSGKRFP